MIDPLPCPVCKKPPSFHGSMVRDAESVGCNWEDHCPREGSFGFQTDYLPVFEAITLWNAEVQKHLKSKEG